MRIGISPGDFTRYGETRYQMLREAGFDCVDFSMADTESGLYLLSGEALGCAIARERELATAAGVEITQVHGPWRWPSRDVTEEDRAERLEKMIRSIRMTARLGCRYWVVHPIMPFGIEEKDSDLAAVTYEMNVAFMRELLTVAHEVDVIICLENMPMPHFSLGSPQAILNFVQEINDTHLKICLDTGHVSVFPSLRVGEAVRALGDQICVLHIHDNRGQRDEHLPPYAGVIDWADFVRALREIGYDGVFSLEPGYAAQESAEQRVAYYLELAGIAHRMLETAAQ